MKILLSPAKSLNEDITVAGHDFTLPNFLDESAYLTKKLKKISAKKIGEMMGISKDLSSLNYQRFQDWSLPFNEKNSIPAGWIFSGAAYQGLDFETLTKKQQQKGQASLRILSGLYGLLRPFDLIQPYRLEMGTKFAVTPKQKNLYQFWGEKIRESLEQDLANDAKAFVVNVASNEYAKAAQLNKIKYPVITAVFKDKNATGDYKVNMQYAKLSRGRMTRFILENDIEKPEDLKAFDAEGYLFSQKDSSEFEFVFLRDRQ